MMVRLCIRELATERGVNMSQLQIAAGVSMGLVRRYWYNKADSVALRALEKIAQALGVRVGALISDEEHATGVCSRAAVADTGRA
jgi:DNA-binding Xre family transcriptional regulator